MSLAAIISAPKEPIRQWWVCPSDRELALRAKINTGFSTIASRANANKYAPLVGPKVGPLSPDEIKIIQDVINKAEAEEKMNNMRISLMISEHHKMVGNCNGDGIISCILCGYKFDEPHSAKPTVCHQCTKVVCIDCRFLDTLCNEKVFLCPICNGEKDVSPY
jgi:hypothetical protein